MQIQKTHMLIKICICKLSIEYAYNPIWIDIRLSRLSFLIDCDTFESCFSSSSLHTHVVGIAELVSDINSGFPNSTVFVMVVVNIM